MVEKLPGQVEHFGNSIDEDLMWTLQFSVYKQGKCHLELHLHTQMAMRIHNIGDQL